MNKYQVFDVLHQQKPSVYRGDKVKGEFRMNHFVKVKSIETNCTCVNARINGGTLYYEISTKKRAPLKGQRLSSGYTATINVTYEVNATRQTDKLQVSFEFKD